MIVMGDPNREAPSNQQWTDGDDHPDIGLATDNWNAIPLTNDELRDFCGLLNAVKKMLQHPHPSAFEDLLKSQQLMRSHCEKWNHFEM